MANFEYGNLLYENSLSNPEEIKDWRLEGDASITFPRNRMRLENIHERDTGVNPHYVFWCPEDFPSNIAISWNFLPHTDAGLAMVWFSAMGCNGEDLFDPKLTSREGDYKQYHHGDINAYHLSYFRRNHHNNEIEFRTCNLRKSYGFYLVAGGGDPLPDSKYAYDFYRIKVIKYQNLIHFFINDYPVFSWEDDGETYGPVLSGGKIGFRQMAGLIADYSDLTVHEVISAS